VKRLKNHFLQQGIKSGVFAGLALVGMMRRVGLFNRTDAFIEPAFPTLRNPLPPTTAACGRFSAFRRVFEGRRGPYDEKPRVPTCRLNPGVLN
jgi:hypothetical protein